MKKGSVHGVAYSYDEGWINSDIYQLFTAQDDPRGSGIKGYEYSFVNQPNNNGVWTFTENNYITQKELLTKKGGTSKDIDTTIYVRAVDNFENKGPVVSYKVRVDQTAPTQVSVGLKKDSVNGEAYNSSWTTSDVYQIFSATDPTGGSGLKGYEYSFANTPSDDSLWTLTTGNSITLSDLLTKKGEKTDGIDAVVYVRSSDNAGNKSVVSSYTVKIDRIKPDIFVSAVKKVRILKLPVVLYQILI